MNGGGCTGRGGAFVLTPSLATAVPEGVGVELGFVDTLAGPRGSYL